MRTVVTLISLFIISFIGTLALPAPPDSLKAGITVLLLGSKLSQAKAGTAQATPLHQDAQYQAYDWTVPVFLGGCQVNLVVDTGSQDLWVYGPQAPSPNRRNVYTPSTSPTSNWAPDEQFNAHYGGSDSYASGPVAFDSVAIGGVTVPRLDIGVADTVGSSTQQQPYYGFLGLGFKSANSIHPNSSPTFVEAALQYLDQPVFTVNFKNDNTGTLGFGHVDHTAYGGNLISAPVSNATTMTWTVEGVRFGLGNQSFTQQMQFDTGGLTTSVDTSVAAAYWAQVAGAVDFSTEKDGSGWEYPCGATLPDFKMIFNGQATTIAGEYITNGPDKNHPNYCWAGIKGSSGGRGTVGESFWLSQYVVFNQAEPSLSFAPKA